MTEKTAVHTPTEEEYDRLMKAYEKKGWVRCTGDKPINNVALWSTRGKRTHVCYGDNFSQAEERFRKDKGYTIITVDEAIAKLGLYERGKEVLVSRDNIKWEQRIYLTTIEGKAIKPYIVVMEGEENRFKEGATFDWCFWEYIKPLDPTPLELTMKDIEDKYGCKVKIVK